ncbi:MAG: hypothetical protein ACI4R9_04645 [Kiritimatiellia bacterium]
MAYAIDFTGKNYRRRAFRKLALRLLAVAAAGAAAYGVYDVYETYNEPTLNMRLAEFEAVARPIEEIDAVWDAASKEYDSLIGYYRLLWSENPTNILAAASSGGWPSLPTAYRPVAWRFATGGRCVMNYRYAFAPGDKAEQARGIEAALVNAVTSTVWEVEGKVEVRGIQSENLLNVDGLDLTVSFTLGGVKTFPAKDAVLSECVKEIDVWRTKIHTTRIESPSAAAGGTIAVSELFMKYLALGKDKPDFPEWKKAVGVAGWLDAADRFIARNRIPGDDRDRKRLKEAWNRIGDARFPWERYRELDNAEFVERTRELGAVADGVRRFRQILVQRREDCRRKLEPFVEAYDRRDIFNKPLVEHDLRERAALPTGLGRVVTAFQDEPAAGSAVLDKDGERFTFSWVRWTLSAGARREDGRDAGPENAGAGDEAITLGKIAACAAETLLLGPGYALESIDIAFGPGGEVAGAVMTGLLPVKRVETIMEK